jgi:hypothetical protein
VLQQLEWMTMERAETSSEGYFGSQPHADRVFRAAQLTLRGCQADLRPRIPRLLRLQEERQVLL